MKKYDELEEVCRQYTEISKYYIDDFLINFCADHENLEEIFEKKISPYRSIVRKFPLGWDRYLLSQYIAFRLFKKDGFAKKYLSHPALRIFGENEYNLFRIYAEFSWRFVYCVIQNHPAPNFFTMIDVFTNESFLLYSPSIEKIIKSKNVSLFFLLLSYNGMCYVTYGLIIDFQSLETSDIYFYARQLDPTLRNSNDVPAVIERNPIPFALLHIGSETPPIYKDNSKIVLNRLIFTGEFFSPTDHSKAFIIKKRDQVYRLYSREMQGFPHFASVTYKPNKKQITLTSLTDQGYKKLANYFEDLGYTLPTENRERVSPLMINLIKEILGYEINFFPYDKDVTLDESPKEQGDREKIQKFIDKIMNDFNQGIDPDIEVYAKECELDLETALSITNKIIDILEDMIS